MVHLACLRGNIGYWTYYSTVIKIKDLVTDNRVITVSESEELYTQNINRILQREINQSRIKSLKKYIIENTLKNGQFLDFKIRFFCLVNHSFDTFSGEPKVNF